MTAVERPAGRPACGARPAGALSIVADDVPHGSGRGVRWHRSTGVPTCVACRRFAAAQRAGQRKRAYLRRGERLVDSCGVRRRLEALGAIGWSQRALAAQLGCHRSNIERLTGVARSSPETVAAVRALYDRLSMVPGPHPRARAHAARRGWAPPLAWDDESIDDPAARPRGSGDRHTAGVAFDEIAVARAMRGDLVHLRPVERAEAVRRLTAAGRSAAEIAVLLHTTKRSVVRHRAPDTSRRSA